MISSKEERGIHGNENLCKGIRMVEACGGGGGGGGGGGTCACRDWWVITF